MRAAGERSRTQAAADAYIGVQRIVTCAAAPALAEQPGIECEGPRGDDTEACCLGMPRIEQYVLFLDDRCRWDTESELHSTAGPGAAQLLAGWMFDHVRPVSGQLSDGHSTDRRIVGDVNRQRHQVCRDIRWIDMHQILERRE